MPKQTEIMELNDNKFKTGIYQNKGDEKNYVEVTEEGCIFCCVKGGVGILCEYPYIGEFCDNCPLKLQGSSIQTKGFHQRKVLRW